MFGQAVFIIRTYAFTGRRKSLLAFLVACSIALLGTKLWIYIAKYTWVAEWHSFIGDTGCFATDRSESPAAFAQQSLKANAVFQLCLLIFDLFMTAVVAIHSIRFPALWGPLAKAFVVHGLMAFFVLSALSLVMAIAFLSRDPKWATVSILYILLSDVIACRLILMFRKQVNPSATTQDREFSRLVQDAIVRLEARENVVIDDAASDHNHAIESWN